MVAGSSPAGPTDLSRGVDPPCIPPPDSVFWRMGGTATGVLLLLDAVEGHLRSHLLAHHLPVVDLLREVVGCCKLSFGQEVCFDDFAHGEGPLDHFGSLSHGPSQIARVLSEEGGKSLEFLVELFVVQGTSHSPSFQRILCGTSSLLRRSGTKMAWRPMVRVARKIHFRLGRTYESGALETMARNGLVAISHDASPCVDIGDGSHHRLFGGFGRDHRITADYHRALGHHHLLGAHNHHSEHNI